LEALRNGPTLLNPKPDVLESNPCFPEPHGGKCGGQADISLSGVAESHGFKKGVQRFSLIAFLFWFVLDKILEKLGGREQFCDRTTTPLLSAECQN